MDRKTIVRELRLSENTDANYRRRYNVTVHGDTDTPYPVPVDCEIRYRVPSKSELRSVRRESDSSVALGQFVAVYGIGILTTIVGCALIGMEWWAILFGVAFSLAMAIILIRGAWR